MTDELIKYLRSDSAANTQLARLCDARDEKEMSAEYRRKGELYALLADTFEKAAHARRRI